MMQEIALLAGYAALIALLAHAMHDATLVAEKGASAFATQAETTRACALAHVFQATSPKTLYISERNYSSCGSTRDGFIVVEHDFEPR